MGSGEDPVDVVIVGAGPAGSALALNLLAKGRRPLIVEKERFPRYHIGESLTGECGQALREFGLEDYMKSAGYPIKRGVTVSGAGGSARFWVPVEARLPDGSRAAATTWQVRREELDAKLLETAIERGAGHIRATCTEVLFDEGRASGIVIREEGGTRPIAARAVADCSGQHTLFCRLGLTSPKQRTGYQNQVSFYAQLRGVRRDDPPNDGNTHIFYGQRDHWAWLIPLDDEVTSAGIVLPNHSFKDRNLSRDELFAAGLAEINPDLTERTGGAEIVSEVFTTSNYSYHIDEFTGPGFVCVGDAHRFLDPIFSFGVSVAIQEARLAAVCLDKYLDDPEGGLEPFGCYATEVNSAQTVVEYIIRTFWEYPLVFLKLAHFSHRDDIAEVFSGRLYDRSVHDLEAVSVMRDLLVSSGKMAA